MNFINIVAEKLKNEFSTLKINRTITNKIVISNNKSFSINLSFNGNTIFLYSVLKWGILTHLISKKTDDEIKLLSSQIIEFFKKNNYNYSILQKSS